MPNALNTKSVKQLPSYRVAHKRSTWLSEIADDEDSKLLQGLLEEREPVRASKTPINWVKDVFAKPSNGRFGDESYSVYYAGLLLKTALAEKKYNLEKFYSATPSHRRVVSFCSVIHAKVTGELHDIRPLWLTNPELYDPHDYRASQKYASLLHRQRSQGLIYRSVRDEGGECLAIFDRAIILDAQEQGELAFEWNGQAISEVYEIINRH